MTILSIVLIATGALGIAFHLADFRGPSPFQYDALGIALVRLTAVVCGVYMLRASNWARWLAISWIAFHVILSFFHSRFELGMHILVFAAFAYFLFRPGSNAYFRGN